MIIFVAYDEYETKSLASSYVPLKMRTGMCKISYKCMKYEKEFICGAS